MNEDIIAHYLEGRNKPLPARSLRDFRTLELWAASGMAREEVLEQMKDPFWRTQTEWFCGHEWCEKCRQRITIEECIECGKSLPADECVDDVLFGKANVLEDRSAFLKDAASRLLAGEPEAVFKVLVTLNTFECKPSLPEWELKSIFMSACYESSEAA